MCCFQCNFFDYRGVKVVYRRYTAFCFVTGITHDEVRVTACVSAMHTGVKKISHKVFIINVSLHNLVNLWSLAETWTRPKCWHWHQLHFFK